MLKCRAVQPGRRILNCEGDCLHIACTLEHKNTWCKVYPSSNVYKHQVYKHPSIQAPKHDEATYLAESGSMASHASASSSDVRRTGMRSCSLQAHTCSTGPQHQAAQLHSLDSQPCLARQTMKETVQAARFEHQQSNKTGSH